MNSEAYKVRQMCPIKHYVPKNNSRMNLHLHQLFAYIHPHTTTVCHSKQQSMCPALCHTTPTDSTTNHTYLIYLPLILSVIRPGCKSE